MNVINELSELTTMFENVLHNQDELVMFGIADKWYTIYYEPENDHKTVLLTDLGEKVFNDPIDTYKYLADKYYDLLTNNQNY